ncbi:Flagellar motor switch protein FliN [hydrothermal vent metagenome]|uniref:Flagellar motor switch protein FliN n=1 Tax=hydrothermal vent metagenome TaxID=652676 RepID=A0A3B0STV5_9ZZZZ
MTMSDEPNAEDTENADGGNDVVLDMAEDDAGEAPVLERRDESDTNGLKRAIFDVPIEVVVSVGRARPLIGDLLAMGRNHLLPIDATIEDPVELLVKDRVIARGELTQVPDTEGQLGIRLTEVVNISALTE